MAKGIKTGGGSRKGVPNKNNQQLTEMIDKALIGAGGVDYLIQQAHENPAAFLSLVGKRVPRNVDADVKGSMTIQVVTGV